MKYKQQKVVPVGKANYGIKSYSKDQFDLHTDVRRLLTSERYKKIPADDCMIVFGRIYSVYCISALKQEGRIK